MWYSFRPYVSAAQKKASALREIAKRQKKGEPIAPVVLKGSKIAETFWGKAWCENLESYSDYSNRLPRGRSYVRNGSVVNLQIHAGKITALVRGSALYTIAVKISPLPKKQWLDIKKQCAGEIGSLVELLQGKLSRSVMDIVTARSGGLFPKPAEIKLECSCPDWADMCKHVAAVLYGVGARLDHQPELLFLLRQVDHLELIQDAVPSTPKTSRAGKKTLGNSEVASVFGIELAEPEPTDSAKAVDDSALSNPQSSGAPRKMPIAKGRKKARSARTAKS